MKIMFYSGGFYCILRYGTEQREPLGFVIKRKSRRLFSERYGLKRGFCLGPLYFRTYARERRNG